MAATEPLPMNLDERNRKLEIVIEISRIIGVEKDLDVLLQRVCEESRRLVNADYSIFLSDRISGDQISRVSHNLERGQIIRVARGEGLIGLVAETQRPIIVNDPYAHDAFCKKVDADSGYRTRNLLSVPMSNLKGACVGVLQAMNKRGGDFIQEDVELLSVLCGQIATAVDNAILHADIERLCFMSLGEKTLDPTILEAPPRHTPPTGARSSIPAFLVRSGGETVAATAIDVATHGVFCRVSSSDTFIPGETLSLEFRDLEPQVSVKMRVRWQGVHERYEVYGIGGAFVEPQPGLTRLLGYRRVEDSASTSTHMVLPPDCNGAGTAFGGQLLKWMNEAAGITAGYHIGGSYVTGSVSEIFFMKAIHQGNFVTLKSYPTYTGRCSLEVAVEVIRDDPASRIRELCLRGYFTFVALSRDGVPEPITPLVPSGAEEERRFEAGHARQMLLRYKRRNHR